MIYIGAIFVLFLFIIMLLHNEETKQGIPTINRIIFFVLDFILIAIILIKSIQKISSKEFSENSFEEIFDIGFVLVNDGANIYALLLLLLFAVITPIIMYSVIDKTRITGK
jgi:NADH:ubiquinone oxidoreductase subunit 6 (subunit J)